ncbi:MAG: Aldehyde dehydrogenase, partial [uncultured Gemmatimonadaceae bacterium]
MTTVAEIFDTMEYGPAPESAEPALRWIRERGGEGAHYIGGQWVQPAGSAMFDVADPSTGRVIARMPQAGAAEVDRAVAAAREAFAGWSALPGQARARHLYAL